MDKLELIKYDLYAQDLRRIKHIEGVAESAIEIKNRHFPFITDETALCAAYMHEHNLSLEEFTDEWQAYIADYNARGGDYEALCKALTTLPDPTATGQVDEEGDAEISFFLP